MLYCCHIQMVSLITKGLMVLSILHQLGRRPVIAALRSPSDLDQALACGVDNIFFMGGDVKDIIYSVKQVKASNRGAFVHSDLIKGLSATDKESVSFIADYVGADGIVSPKAHIIKETKRMNLYGILHLFILDSLALDNGLKLARSIMPDAIELMPGVVGKVIQKFSEELEEIPIVASGLIQTMEEVKACLDAGATSLSVSDPHLWSLTYEQLQL